MTTYRCPSCDRQIEPAPECPHCGAVQGGWAEDLARIERSIAEMKARDVAIAKEQKQIASKLQAAVFQRDILAHANDKRGKGATKPRRVLRRRPGQRPPTANPGPPPPRIPRQTGRGGDQDPPPPPPPPGPQVADLDDPEARPEASQRQVQNILLGLGALLLGVAAVVFAVVAISTLDTLSRMTILVAATGLLLLAAPLMARRALTSTAETLAGVGLLLVPLTAYALWTAESVRTGVLSGAVFGALAFAVTAGVAAFYTSGTGLTVPRYATVVAVQPIIPLLAYDWIRGPAGWALTLTAVAALDLYLARLFAQPGRLVLPPWLGRRPGPAAGAAPDAAPGTAEPGTDRPESAPEESDAVVTAEPPGTAKRRHGDPFGGPDTDDVGPPFPGADEPVKPRPAEPAPAAAAAPATFWLRELTWVLHGLAIGAALVYAVAALVDADTVAAATRAGATLLLAALIGLLGAHTLRQPPLPDLAAGILTLAVIGAAGRVAALALPGRALLIIAVVITLTGVGVRALPAWARRGPQLASVAALVVIGVVVAGGAVRAALAPIRAATPIWEADLVDYPHVLAAAVASTGWQLAATAFLLTIAAILSLPTEVRSEFAVAGAALTALAAPASLGLPWWAAPWPPVLAAIGIGAAGLWTDSDRAARVHLVGAGLVGFAGAGTALARPGLTAAALLALTAGGILVALLAATDTVAPGTGADLVGPWAAGGAAFAAPGAVAALVAASVPLDANPTTGELQDATLPVLAASFLAVCATLGYAAVTQVAKRQISPPLALGSSLGALGVAAVAFGTPGGTVTDTWVAVLLVAAAVLLLLSPAIDAGRRADRLFDGPDFAAAAATAALVGTLSRIATILLPGAELVVTAALIVVVAFAVRAMPADWRRGPILGVTVSGAVIAAIAGWTAVSGGLRVLATPGAVWAGDLDAWQFSAGDTGWQMPVALVLLAGAAAVLLPRPWSYDVAGVCVGLATIGTPAAFGMPWWSPIVVGGLVATGYGIFAVSAADPRAGLTRAAVAAAVALHAVGASLVRPWTTAAALGVIALVGVVVAVLARMVATLPDDDGPVELPVDADPMPPHLATIGGAATGGALLALPGALAALAAEFNRTEAVVLAAALAGSSLGVAVLALVGRGVPRYLPYATIGVAGGATVTAAVSLPTDAPTGVYAAAAALLAVLAELLRAATPPPGSGGEPAHRWTVMLGGVMRRMPAAPVTRWSISPVRGAIVLATVPTVLAFVTIAPALLAALVQPYQSLWRIWQGPPADLGDAVVEPTNVLTALLLTVATALAAVGFSGGRPAEAIPVSLPGIALTLLIAPISLGLDWPDGTLAGLAVFAIAMLGLALTPPPPDTDRARPVRVARVIVFAIGLAAGGAGLAGSLATADLTLLALGGAVVVGAVAAIFGRSARARILGWVFGAVMAQLFVFTIGVAAGFDPAWSAFGVLGVGALLLLVAARLPRLRQPEATREASTVEWSGYGAALIAAALAYDSPRHVAALLAAWGAVLGVAAIRPGRGPVERRTLFWAAVGCEISAWWLLMGLADVALPEAYTLPFAVLALLVGLLELRQRSDLGSWAAFGPALVAAFLPSLVIMIATDTSTTRRVLLLFGAVATLIIGSVTRRQAPVVTGAVATALVALHALTLAGGWWMLIPTGIVLVALGASNERRRRTQDRVRGALFRMK
ncbi:SCO7613 C-terminal domain-containing membrane protein [Polymorphospora rubra]|uniref:SCO7613 C-terminal domain-containing membrane protein n=1 Tax=Polymorphospora rubra TaxID=338584 RepID=UPI0033DA079C